MVDFVGLQVNIFLHVCFDGAGALVSTSPAISSSSVPHDNSNAFPSLFISSPFSKLLLL